MFPIQYPGDISIVAYEPQYHHAFRQLNHEWITKYFKLEAKDNLSLDDPEQYILARGGYIIMALRKGEPVGTVALIRESDRVFELAKMAVTDKAKGLKIGYYLGKAALELARQQGAETVNLLSNRRLAPALNLYRKLGFIEVPMPANEYERADIYMEIKL